MKTFPVLPLLGLLFLAGFLSAGQARTDTEIRNFLKQSILPDLQSESITVSEALAFVQEHTGLKKKKITLSIAVPQKADQTRIAVDFKNTNALEAIRTICERSRLEFAIRRDQILIF